MLPTCTGRPFWVWNGRSNNELKCDLSEEKGDFLGDWFAAEKKHFHPLALEHHYALLSPLFVEPIATTFFSFREEAAIVSYLNTLPLLLCVALWDDFNLLVICMLACLCCDQAWIFGPCMCAIGSQEGASSLVSKRRIESVVCERVVLIARFR